MRILTILGLLYLLRESYTVATLIDVNNIGLSLNCKNYDNPSSLTGLKRYLFCEYDRNVRPTVSHHIVNNVTIQLLPKILEFDDWNSRMTLHSWMTLVWSDVHLSWEPSKFDGINFIHMKSDEIWVPDISVYNSGDMSMDQTGIPPTLCLIMSSGTVSCVPSMRHVAKCATDFSSWPYDTHRCRINLGSWVHTGEEVSFHLDRKGFQMEGFSNNSEWDFKVVNAYKVLKKYKCCPNDSYPMITYEFDIRRHHGIMHTTYITPAIALMLLTLTVLWLDSRSTERMAMAGMNLICHMLCIFDLHWQLPHNGTNPPSILLYYRNSLLLAVFALMLTALLRKMQEINIEVPYWISTTTSFVLSNRAGRFLILADDDSKLSTERILSGETEDNSELPKPRTSPKESSWRHFAAIIEWLFFFLVIFIYVIIIIILVPSLSRLNMKNLFPVLFVIFDVLLIKQATSSSIFCKDIPRNTSMLQLYNYLFCNYNSYERSIDKNKNTTAIDFGLNVYHFQVNNLENTVEFNVWIRLIWKDSHFVWKPQDFGNIRSIRVTSNMIWTPDIVIHSATPWNVDMEIPTTQCIIQYDGTVIYVAPIIYLTFCDFDHTWWPYDMMNCSIHIASWSHSNKEVTLRSKNFKLEPELLLDAPYKNLEWETVEISQSKHEVDFKFGLGFTTDLLAYNILIKRKSSMYSIIYMTFAIALMMTTLMVLWLEPKSMERMIIANLNFVLHLLCLLELNWMIPFNGAYPPQLLVFYEKSLVLAAFSLILTSTLRYLEELNNEAPMWVSSTIVSILESRVGQVFLVSILDPKVSARIEMNVDDNTNLMSLDKKEFTWRYTSILIGWLAFLSVLFVYIIILIVSLPTSWYKSSFPLKSNL
ncbi:PREDICTED: uncharacterized protein LOC108549775 [Eufriesea mexicana]|uniref:uncharacterized protein LOC108549775 n=1 Tax=Eufriesea mexicana TaxID=516756 RepID=UPI00083C536F|nr:PREDICTED: uncharacterized protein LOC108549775 [Eufriesea mexicana]